VEKIALYDRGRELGSVSLGVQSVRNNNSDGAGHTAQMGAHMGVAAGSATIFAMDAVGKYGLESQHM
jgi:hypothetical protein